jgi:hypothetical protein
VASVSFHWKKALWNLEGQLAMLRDLMYNAIEDAKLGRGNRSAASLKRFGCKSQAFSACSEKALMGLRECKQRCGHLKSWKDGFYLF